jgi:hypothetical protein
MSADQVAKISPTVREVLDAPGDGLCATFEVVGVDDAWAQVMKGTLNIAYPFTKPPEVADVVASLPGATVQSWEAEKFATFSFDSADACSVAMTIDRLFTKFFACDDYSVDCRIEDHDA